MAGGRQVKWAAPPLSAACCRPPPHAHRLPHRGRVPTRPATNSHICDHICGSREGVGGARLSNLAGRGGLPLVHPSLPARHRSSDQALPAAVHCWPNRPMPLSSTGREACWWGPHAWHPHSTPPAAWALPGPAQHAARRSCYPPGSDPSASCMSCSPLSPHRLTYKFHQHGGAGVRGGTARGGGASCRGCKAQGRRQPAPATPMLHSGAVAEAAAAHSAAPSSCRGRRGL